MTAQPQVRSLSRSPGSMSRSLQRNPTVDHAVLGTIKAESDKLTVAAADIVSGEAWLTLAAQHARAFQRILGSCRCIAPNRPITWASACSGSNGDLAVAKCMRTAYHEIGLTGFDLHSSLRYRVTIDSLQPEESTGCSDTILTR